MYFLGIDTSTTGSKALLIDERGEVGAGNESLLSV
jgi:sugar (pentulose or hexulose) kinase